MKKFINLVFNIESIKTGDRASLQFNNNYKVNIVRKYNDGNETFGVAIVNEALNTSRLYQNIDREELTELLQSIETTND